MKEKSYEQILYDVVHEDKSNWSMFRKILSK